MFSYDVLCVLLGRADNTSSLPTSAMCYLFSYQHRCLLLCVCAYRCVIYIVCFHVRIDLLCGVQVCVCVYMCVCVHVTSPFSYEYRGIL